MRNRKNSFLFTVLATLLLLSAPAGFSAESAPLLAVEGFRAIGVGESVAASVTELMRAELSRSRRLTILEETGRLFKMQKNSARFRDLIARESLIELGELLESRSMLTGSVSSLDSTIVISARVVDVETGVTLVSEVVEHTGGVSSISSSVRMLARRVLSHFPAGGKVTSVKGDTLVADIGLDDGLIPGQELTVVNLPTDRPAEPDWTKNQRTSVRVRVERTMQNESYLVPLIPDPTNLPGVGALVMSASGFKDTDLDQQQRAEQAREKAELQSNTGDIRITSKPEGALVALSRLDVGRTPLTVSDFVSGTHPVAIYYQGYDTIYDSVRIIPGQLNEYSYNLLRRLGVLSIVTVQEDVTLRLDTLDIHVGGTGSVTVKDFPAGEHHLTAAKPGYETINKRLELDFSSGDTTITVDMNPYPGSLLIASQPVGAMIYIDGVYTGAVTPQRLTHLPAGTRRIRLLLPGKGAAVTDHDIVPGSIDEVNIPISEGWFDFQPEGMALVPAGYLDMADGDSVYVSAFYLDTCEVTNREYAYFVRSTGAKPPKHWKGNSPAPEIENLPVVNVSYNDAARFASWAGMQLPSEAQWMRAAFQNGVQKFPWGDSYRPGAANTWSEGWGEPVRGGSYPQDVSPAGVYDLVGNVAEWVCEPIGVIPDRDGDLAVHRGGSFYVNDTDPSLYNRDWLYPISGAAYIGFRCVMPVPAAAN